MIILMQGLVETFAVVLISFVLIPQVSCLNVVVEVSSNAKRLEHWNFTVDLARKAAQYRDKFLQSTTSKARPGREVTFNRRLCVLGSDVKNKQAQKAEIVDIGDVVQLPCRLCDNDMQRSRDAHVWFKFYRYVNDASPGQSAWKVAEVALDRHDDEALNRVTTLPDHTLVIKDFQPIDAGTYFCEQYLRREERLTTLTFSTDSGHGEASAISLGLAWKRMAGDHDVDFLFHLDVTLPSTHVLVSHEKVFMYATPSKPRVIRAKNVVMFMEWSEWSECSVCGRKAERRRLGRCLVGRWSESLVTSNEYLDFVFANFPQGVPCQSSLFINHADIITRGKDEVEVSTCRVPCDGESDIEEISDLSGEDTKTTTPKNKKPDEDTELDQVVHESYHAQPGESLILMCPFSRIHNMVAWFNGTTLLLSSDLAVSTDFRIIIDATQTLNFKALIPSDNGNYSCFIDGVKKARFEVLVESDSDADIRFYMVLLLLVYAVDGVVFTVCMCVKYGTQRVRLARKK